MMRKVMRRALVVVAIAATALIGWHIYTARQEHAKELFSYNFWQGPLNTPVVYGARVMPYVIDSEGSCSVPKWLDRGVYIAREPCEDGLKMVDYGALGRKDKSWWNVMQNMESTAGHEGTQKKWKTSLVGTDENPFVHALELCGMGSHMACMIMDPKNGPYHTVQDPLTVLADETMAPNTNEDTVHQCGPSYKDCVVVPASSPELFFNRDFKPDFDDDQFKELVKKSNYFFRELGW